MAAGFSTQVRPGVVNPGARAGSRRFIRGGRCLCAAARLRRASRRRRSGTRSALRKDTSNLFRDRAHARKQRLDLRALQSCARVDPPRVGRGRRHDHVRRPGCRNARRGRDAGGRAGSSRRSRSGGAAAGVGIEASSFRHGLVHESLLELDVLTGDGRVVTCTPDNEHARPLLRISELLRDSRLRARLKPARSRRQAVRRARASPVRRPGRFFAELEDACHGDADFVDGVVFGPGEMLSEHGALRRRCAVRQRLFVRAHLLPLAARTRVRLPERARFHLALGHRLVLVLEERRRADSVDPPPLRARAPRLPNLSADHALEQPLGIDAALDRVARALRGVGHPGCRHPDRNAAAFLDFFQRDIGIVPIWVCPIRARIGESLPAVRARAAAALRELRLLGCRPASRCDAPHHFNRAIEDKVVALGGSSRSIRRASSAGRPSMAVWRRRLPDAQGEIRSRRGVSPAVRQMRIEGLTGSARPTASPAERSPAATPPPEASPPGFSGHPAARNSFPGANAHLRLRADAPRRVPGRHREVSMRMAELPCPAPRGSSCSSPLSGRSRGTSCTRSSCRSTRISPLFPQPSPELRRSAAEASPGGSRRRGLRRGRRRFAWHCDHRSRVDASAADAG